MGIISEYPYDNQTKLIDRPVATMLDSAEDAVWICHFWAKTRLQGLEILRKITL